MAGDNPALKLSAKDRKKHEGKWVACYGWSNFKVLTSGNTMSIVVEKAMEKGLKHPIIFFVNPIKTRIY